MSDAGVTLGELSEHLHAKLHGDPVRRVTGVAPLDKAGTEHLSFLAVARFRAQLDTTRAGVVILADRDLAACPVPALVTKDPYLAYAKAVRLLHPITPVQPGIAAGAHIAPEASVHDSVRVDAGSVIETEARLGPGVWVGPGCTVGRGAVIGAGTQLLARVSVLHDVQVGCNVLLHSGAVIGADGFGFACDDKNHWVNIPQQGSVWLGDNVEIGANSTVDRGTMDDTVIAEGVKIDNQVHVGHNVKIGAHTIIAGCTGIGGSTVIGPACRIGGGCGIASQVHIAGGVSLAAGSQVGSTIKKPGTYASGIPVTDIRSWRRNTVRYWHLDQSLRRVNQTLGQLTAAHAPDVRLGLNTPAGTLDTECILQLLPHRYPFMLIDRVIDYCLDEPSFWLKAVKNVSFNESFFQGHFPGQPIMPGVLVLEVLAQAAAILFFLIQKQYSPGTILYLAGLDKTRIRQPVRPGDRLYIDVQDLQLKRRHLRCRCEARVDTGIVTSTVLTAVIDKQGK